KPPSDSDFIMRAHFVRQQCIRAATAILPGTRSWIRTGPKYVLQCNNGWTRRILTQPVNNAQRYASLHHNRLCPHRKERLTTWHGQESSVTCTRYSTERLTV